MRWQSGIKGQYRFGFDGKFDLQICDPFSPEAVRYREEMMRTPAALKYPSGASASHNEGTSFIKKKSQNIMVFGLVTLLGFLDISAL